MAYITTFDIAFIATLAISLIVDIFTHFVTRKLITKWLSSGMGEVKLVKKSAMLIAPQIPVYIAAIYYCLSLSVEGTVTACFWLFIVGSAFHFCYGAYKARKLNNEVRQAIAEA